MSVLAPVRRLVGRLTGEHRPPELPSTAWFDEPDAVEQISARSHGAADAATLRSWVRPRRPEPDLWRLDRVRGHRRGVGAARVLPGSHRRELFGGFDGYPLVNLRTADAATAAAYDAHVGVEADEFDEHAFLARKGDVLFWHGMLIHGGRTIRRPDPTRRSYVVHFIPAGADVAGQITGPTNW